MLTETTEYNGAKVTFSTTLIDGSPYTKITVVKGGKQVLSGSWDLNYSKFSPEAHQVLDPIARRLHLAILGRTEESENNRIASLKACDDSYDAIVSAMSR